MLCGPPGRRVLVFSCWRGFRLQGPQQLACSRQARDDQPPVCKGQSPTGVLQWLCPRPALSDAKNEPVLGGAPGTGVPARVARRSRSAPAHMSPGHTFPRRGVQVDASRGQRGTRAGRTAAWGAGGQEAAEPVSLESKQVFPQEEPQGRRPPEAAQAHGPHPPGPLAVPLALTVYHPPGDARSSPSGSRS